MPFYIIFKMFASISSIFTCFYMWIKTSQLIVTILYLEKKIKLIIKFMH